VDVDVGEYTAGAEGAVMDGGAVPPDGHVSRLNCVVVTKEGASVCRWRRSHPDPHALYPSPAHRAHTNRVTDHVTVSGAKTSTCSASAATYGEEVRMYILAHRHSGHDQTRT